MYTISMPGTYGNQKRVFRSLETGINRLWAMICELPCGCWELNLGSLSEQFLSPEPSPQPWLCKSHFHMLWSEVLRIFEEITWKQGFASWFLKEIDLEIYIIGRVEVFSGIVTALFSALSWLWLQYLTHNMCSIKTSYIVTYASKY